VPWHLFHRVFDSRVHSIHVSSIVVAAAEESIVNLSTTTEQNRCRDDGHESLRFLSSFVQLRKTIDCQTLGRYLAIVESKLPPLWTLRPRPSIAQEGSGCLVDLPICRVWRLLCGPTLEVKSLYASWLVKGEVLWTLGETRVAEQNAAKVYQIEIIALAIAGGTLDCKKCSIQCSTVKGVCLDADNCSVLEDWVDKLHCAAVKAAEASGRRNVWL